MKHLVEFSLENGGSIVVEVEEPEIKGNVRVARDDAIVKANITLEKALHKILPVTKTIVEELRNLAHSPDEIEVSFGVKLNTMAGAMIASASAEGNFDVTVRWTGKSTDATHEKE